MASAEPSLPNLKEYIASMRKSGFSDDEARKKLLDAGWDARLVEGALGPGKKTAPGAASSAPAQQGVLSPVRLIEDTIGFLSREASFWLPFALALFAIMATTGIISYALSASIEGIVPPSPHFPTSGDDDAVQGMLSSLLAMSFSLAAALFVAMLSGVLSLIVQMGFMAGVAARREGRPFTFSQGLSVGLSKLIPAIVASVLMVLGVVFGLVLLIIPGIYLLVAWVLVDPAIAIGGKGALSSFSESRRLINGRWWHAFSVGLLSTLAVVAYMLLAMLIEVALGLMQAVMPSQGRVFLDILEQIASSAIAVPPSLFIMALLALFYLNLRENTPEGA